MKSEIVHSSSLVLKLGMIGQDVLKFLLSRQHNLAATICAPLFGTKFQILRKYFLLLKEDKCDRSFFNFVATLQDEFHSERIYISFYLFCINSNNNRNTEWSKI